ncbi:MAG: gamma-glutamyltransferase, partial [Paracoccaceae bacterium]
MRRFLMAMCLSALPVGLVAQQAADTVAPEAPTATGFEAISPEVAASLDAKAEGRPVAAQDWMVAAANPHAAEAAARVLRAGGSAADAMVAVQAVLGLVEPQSSGLGGGAFLVWYDAESGELTTLDGRETAPLEARPTLFQDPEGAPLRFFEAVVGGRSVGTPGTPALMQEAHDRWGRLPWPDLFDAAVDLAEEGFAVSPRLAGLVALDALRLSRFEATRDYFFPGGKPLEVGQVLRNPAYAETLRILAAEGAEAFYAGPIARDITAAVRGAEGNPGVLGEVDLAIYEVTERAPVCVSFRAHEVCGMGPPSSGGLTVGQILGMLDHFDLGEMAPDSAEAWRLIGDASRLAFADRGLYMADSDFVPVPVRGLLDPDYLAGRADLLRREGALDAGEVVPGSPDFDHALNWAPDESLEFPSTSHVSIVDGFGNALSLTTTIENGFGSRLMVRGFLLNNELTDFSFRTHRDGRPIANAVAPGKRPRSSMAPTVVLKDGAPVAVLGSPGGSRIIGYVAKTVIALLDWGLDPQAAVALPHAINQFGRYDLEAGNGLPGLRAGLEALQFEVKEGALNSGLHVVTLSPEGLL